eukprot:NODE_64_length_26047_cov_1.706837.p15 type:complete len:144 gc:universal NODE_64_length_26047_cov_1.706837:21475-21044(-)
MAKVFLAGYGFSKSIGTANIEKSTDGKLLGDLKIDFEGLKAAINFSKDNEKEEIVGELTRDGEIQQINFSNSNLIQMFPEINICGFVVRLEQTCESPLKVLIEKQSLHNASRIVLSRILLKENEMDSLVDLVIEFLKTGKSLI